MIIPLILAASLTLPVAEVTLRPDELKSTYPGRVVSIAQVDVIPQVSGEIKEVAFANGGLTAVKEALGKAGIEIPFPQLVVHNAK